MAKVWVTPTGTAAVVDAADDRSGLDDHSGAQYSDVLSKQLQSHGKKTPLKGLRRPIEPKKAAQVPNTTRPGDRLVPIDR